MADDVRFYGEDEVQRKLKMLEETVLGQSSLITTLQTALTNLQGTVSTQATMLANHTTQISTAQADANKNKALFAKNVSHNATGKLLITSRVVPNVGWSRQSFFIFSFAGGSFWASILAIHTSNGANLTSYQNIIGTRVTGGEVYSSTGSYLVGKFTLQSIYDSSVILSEDDFDVSR